MIGYHGPGASNAAYCLDAGKASADNETISRFPPQEFLQALPPKKAEADALFELCQRSGKECMRLANQGASQSGTLLVSIYDRLHAMQNDLNNAPVCILQQRALPAQLFSCGIE
jgi:hypothetical protein